MARSGDAERTLDGEFGRVSIRRDEHGIPHIEGDGYQALLHGLGWAHGHDRMVAMELTRIIGKGEVSEKLDGSPEMVEVDRVMRRHRLWADSLEQAREIDRETSDLLDAYCAGANRAMGESIPWEFKLLRHRPGPWTHADCILLLRMMGLVDLTETQGWMEKFIIQMLQNGVPLSMVKEMFPCMTEEPDEEYLDILRKVRLSGEIVPPTVRWSQVPRFESSNNWAVAGERTASGEPILCGDPHLDTGRLPAIWYEAVMSSEDFYFAGATVPGIPAPALGRTGKIAWSPTYGCTDASDYFIEEVRDGKYRRGRKWLDLEVREEVVRVKGGEPVTMRFYESHHGVLEREPDRDGYYLSFGLSTSGCGSGDMRLLMDLPRVGSVKEAMESFSRMEFGAFNWVLADNEGNIGYQMSGRCPVRAPGASGLLPLPGWKKENDWKGFYPPEKNPALYNPPEGYICTANQDMNAYGPVEMINLPMSDDRARRIAELLEKRSDHDVEGMKEMHYDVYSKQAERFMPVIRPLLPDTRNGRLLKEWNLEYDSASTAPTLFERIYGELQCLVFGESGMGRDVMRHLLDETILPYIFYGNFDRVLLSERSGWFGGRTREEVFKVAIERALRDEAPPYGSTRMFVLENILFGGRLPGFLGFDYGPIELIGGRSTVSQGQLFNTFGGRSASFSPTYRFVADFSEEGIHTCLAGGPSDRRFSRWYTSGIKDWQEGRYHRLCP